MVSIRIHSLFVLKRSGACIYNKDFTDEFEFEINLISPFFSSILTFSEKVIYKDLEILEMSDLRFVFEVKKDFIFVLFADSTVSLLFATNCLSRIIEEFFDIFEDLSELKDYQQIENEEFAKKVDSIISGEDEIYDSKDLYEKVIKMFKNLIFENEILGAAMLSTKGNIIYSSLPNKILVRSLKELEIRFMTGAMHLPEMYYQLRNQQKVFSRIVQISWKSENFLIVLLFDKSVPLGMCQINLDKVSKKIRNLI